MALALPSGMQHGERPTQALNLEGSRNKIERSLNSQQAEYEVLMKLNTERINSSEVLRGFVKSEALNALHSFA